MGVRRSWQWGSAHCLTLSAPAGVYLGVDRPEETSKAAHGLTGVLFLTLSPTVMLPAKLLFLHWLRGRVPKDLEDLARALDI